MEMPVYSQILSTRRRLCGKVFLFSVADTIREGPKTIFWLWEFSYQFVSVSWELIWNHRRAMVGVSEEDKTLSFESTTPLKHSACVHLIFLSIFSQSNYISSVCRLRKQNMCTVRGELCIVSGQERLLHIVWTSFGYAWAQVLCSMP